MSSRVQVFGFRNGVRVTVLHTGSGLRGGLGSRNG